MTAAQQGLPTQSETLSLLNESYNGWGTSEYFRWKYDLYPEYDPEQHCFHINVDDKLAAFRRAFYKEIVGSSQKNSIFVLGDTAVKPEYRGQGLYSRLHARTVEFCDSQDVDRLTTFNRKTNTTYEANLGRGWDYRELPLKIRILSPDVVLQRYAALVMSNYPVLTTVADRVGDRVHITTSNGQVPLGDFTPAEDTDNSSSHTVGPSVSDQTLVRLIDLACSDTTIEPLGTLLNGWLTTQQRSKHTGSQGRGDDHPYQVSCKQSISSTEFESIVGLYDSDTTSFRRTPADIRHIIQYPDSDIILIKQDDELIGYTVVGPRSRANVLEGRVLELRVEDEDAFDVLIDEIERVAIDRGFDLIIVFSKQPIGELWASVDQQVIMWTDLDHSSPRLVDSCQISLYDVM